MQLTINVPDQFAADARTRGMEPESYAERLLAESVSEASGTVPRESLAAAVAAMKELRRGNRLNGLTIRELIDEGRKY